MNTRLIAVLSVALVAVVAIASVVKVPAGGGAFCRGRYLGPGIQLKVPFARVLQYETADQAVSVAKALKSRDGERQDFSFTASYRWDFQRLPTEPVDPSLVQQRLLTRLAELDGSYPSASLGSQTEMELRKELDSFPVIGVRIEADYPSPAFAELKSLARPTGHKLVIVGVDGFDWGLLDRLIAEGKCPTFAKMKQNAAWGEIVSRPPVLSPLIWTTMGTGRMPDVHGIVDFVVRDSATGKDVPITNQSRKVHAFWNILSAIDLKVNVVNWWATYPAERINGVMVSERVFYQLFGIRPELDDPANISPPEVAAELLPLLVEAEDISYEEVAGYADISRPHFDRELEKARLAENPFDNRLNHLRKIIAVTRGVFNVSGWLLENRPADVLALYIEGTDTIGHRFAHLLPPKLRWVSQQEYDRYHETMGRYYEMVDRHLGDLMESGPPDATWIVVPDHGFFSGAARPSVPPDDFATGAPQWHRMVGAFLASGPLVRPGKIEHVHIDDLCRTILWLQGAPISRQIRGRELTDLFDEAWVAENPPIMVETYEDLPKTWIGEERTSLLDDARVQELRALGYLADETAAPSPETGRRTTGSTSTGTEMKVTEPYNLGAIARREGRFEDAERHYLQSIEIEPDFVEGMLALSLLYSEMGQHEKGLRWILRALESSNARRVPRLVLDLVREAKAVGRADRILPVLDMIGPAWQGVSTYHTARGQVLLTLEQPDAAVTEFRKALEIDPADPVATEELMALAGQGVVGDTDQILDEHLDAVWNDLKKLNDLAVVCLRQRKPDLAERALRRVLGSDPTNPGVISNLAVALQMQGKHQQALELLSDAVAARPDDASLQFNLGGVLASLGRNEEALVHVNRSERLGNDGDRLFVAKSKILVRLGRVDEARATLERGLRRYPQHAEIGELLAILQGGG
jgi:predicted AlkP superfamily phosphohydrolase/phosphomutase/Flp pilus assembly protein TadD